MEAHGTKLELVISVCVISSQFLNRLETGESLCVAISPWLRVYLRRELPRGVPLEQPHKVQRRLAVWSPISPVAVRVPALLRPFYATATKGEFQAQPPVLVEPLPKQSVGDRVKCLHL